MEPDEYRRMFDAEAMHWWFQGKRAIVERLIARFAEARPAGRVLDVGCGTGATLQMLAGYGDAHGVDVEPLALRLCRRRGLHRLAAASAEHLPFRAEQFDVITVLDVLYHRRIDHMAAALREARRVCRPGGLLVVTDCAYAWLRSRHDAAVHGARRFRRADLEAAIAESGFEVLMASYMNTILFPLAAAARLVDRARHGTSTPQSSLGSEQPRANRVLAGIYRLEARLLGRVRFPFGLSVVVVGRRP